MRYRYFLYLLQLLLLLIAPVALSASTQPKNWNVEVELFPLTGDDSTEILQLVPKQSVLMKVSVWYPATEAWLVNYPDWDMPGASIEKTRTDVPNVEREVDGLLQYGHTQKYILTPVDIGRLKLRQNTMDVSVYQDGSAVIPFPNPIELDVSLPEGVYAMDRFLPAHELDVQQEFIFFSNSEGEQPLELAAVAELTLEKGEMLERRVTLTAKGVKGSSIPITLLPKQHDGMQSESTYKDIQGLFGFEGGERVDSYFFSPGGVQVELSPLSIEWWDLDERKLKTIDLPGASFDSVEVDAYEQAIALSWWEKNITSIFSWLIITLTVFVLAVTGFLSLKFLFYRVYSSIQSIIMLIVRSEKLLFLKLALAIMFGDKIKTRRSFIQWQYRQKIKTTPKLIADYIYSDYQNLDQPRPVSRWQVVLACYRLRLSENNNQVETKKYQLPEL